MAMSMRRSLSALKGAPLSTWWRTDIRFMKREVAWTNGWCGLPARLHGGKNVHVVCWRPLRHRWDKSLPRAPWSPDVAALRTGTPGLV